MDYINANYGDPELGVSAVARSVDISEGHLSHVFKKETGYTLTGYITACRMHMAMHLLRDRPLPRKRGRRRAWLPRYRLLQQHL